jgi:hypothetical protein
VVLRVHGDRGAQRGRGLADHPRVLQRDLLPVTGQGLPHRGQLDRHLHGGGEAGVAEGAQELQIGIARGLRVLPVGGVLTEPVEADEPAGVHDGGAGPYGVGDRGAGHEALHDGAGDRGILHQAADGFAA